MLNIPLHSRFSQTFKHEGGWTFEGTLQPVKDQKIYTDDYFYFRQILRVRPSSTTKAGHVVYDQQGKPYLLGELEETVNYRSFRVYPLNTQTDWKRPETEIDTLTQLPKSRGSLRFMGRIWVLSEMLSRELWSSSITTREDIHRVITGEKVELGDEILGQRVTKVNQSLGVRILEIA